MTPAALLLLVFGSISVALLHANFLPPYLGVGGGTLLLSLVPMVGFVAAVAIGLHGRDVDRRQFWVCLVTIGLLVGLAFIRQVGARGSADLPLGIHDGAIHTEEAAKVLLRGRNPYHTDFAGTPYAALNPRIPQGPAVNVVWSHYIYPPLSFLLQAPWQFIGQQLGFVADVRWVYLAVLIAVTLIVAWSSSKWSERSQWLLFTLGNPLVWLMVMVGYNDVLPALAIILSAWGMRKQRWIFGGIAFGLALAAKQSTWVLLPLWLVWLWRLRRDGNRAGARTALLGTLASAGAVFVPFLIWNAPALLDDIVRYASGSIPFSYPISGTTFLQYLYQLGLVSSPWSVIPTYLFQLVVGIPSMGLAAWWFWRQPTPSRWLAGGVMVMLAVLLFSRYFNLNYLTALVLIGAASLAWHTRETTP